MATEMVELRQGQIKVESQEGEGRAFAVTLFIRQSQEPPCPRDETC